MVGQGRTEGVKEARFARGGVVNCFAVAERWDGREGKGLRTSEKRRAMASHCVPRTMDVIERDNVYRMW